MTRKTQKKLRKLLTLVCCAVMLVCVTVGATVAYLTSQDTVTNTFSVGKVAITMDEANVDNDGEVKDNEGNVTTAAPARDKQNDYHLIPGHSYTKDPTIHIEEGSELSYLFVKVENGIEDIEAAYKMSDRADNQLCTIEEQMGAYDWFEVEGYDNLWVWGNFVDGATGDVWVFDGFKVAETVVGGEKPEDPEEGVLYIADYLDAKIVINAYAVQADGFCEDPATWVKAEAVAAYEAAF